MPKLILFEGTDGSGKSTLIEKFRDYLTSRNLSSQIISKEKVALAGSITRIYKYSDVPNEVEIFLRIAREFSKADAIDKTKDFALVDRAILSLATTITNFGHKWELYRNIIDLIKAKYGEFTTVFCYSPFNIARQRITVRAEQEGYVLSKKEAKGLEYNLRIFNILQQLSDNKYLTGMSNIKVDTDQFDEEQALSILIEHILDS